MKGRTAPYVTGLALLILIGVFAIRWSTFTAGFWNVDETIHAAVARVIQDGGVLYRDAIDQRGPLSYYAVAAVFAVAGENNLAAVRAAIAALIAATAILLLFTAARRGSTWAGAAAGLLYAVLSSTALYPGDAYAAHTEWFVALFTSAAALVFLGGGIVPSSGRLLATGALFAAAFLSKQPALLDLAAPAATLLYLAWHNGQPHRRTAVQFAALLGGWLLPVGAVAAWFAAHDALREAAFYAWTYNVRYYGPEITTADRFVALQHPFKLLLAAAPALVLAWVVGAALALFGRRPPATAPEAAAAWSGRIYILVWSLSSITGAASSGRDFEHYTIQFLPAFCLGAGLALAAVATHAGPNRRWPVRLVALVLIATVTWQVGHSLGRLRGRMPLFDPTARVSEYIREHSRPDDRVFVWGFQSEIYLNANRPPASRFVFCSFLTGLIPWTNVAPDRDTRYAIVPGAMDQLLQDLHARRPRFIVDCSAGPNRHWEKYPLDDFPPLDEFVQRNYRQVEAQRFLHQGFRLYERRPEAELAAAANPDVTAATLATLAVGPQVPLRAAGLPNGLVRLENGAQTDFFAHAPSVITYVLPANIAAVSGSFGFSSAAYAANNAGPTDGAEFVIRWRPRGRAEQVLLRRILRPREEPADRPFSSFRLALPSHAGGEIEFIIRAGPADNNASDWTLWRDLAFEPPTTGSRPQPAPHP